MPLKPDGWAGLTAAAIDCYLLAGSNLVPTPPTHTVLEDMGKLRAVKT